MKLQERKKHYSTNQPTVKRANTQDRNGMSRHENLAKERFKTEVNAPVDHLLSPSTALAEVTSSSTHHLINIPIIVIKGHNNIKGRHLLQRNGVTQVAQENAVNIMCIIKIDGYRVVSIIIAIDGTPQYTLWTAWSPCSRECVQRRERYCKTKRKCELSHAKFLAKHGDIKAFCIKIVWLLFTMEVCQYFELLNHLAFCCQGKISLRCHPAWPEKSNSLLQPHAVQQQQYNQQQQVNSAPPTIVINAAAAAATAPVSTTSVITHPESQHQLQLHATLPPTPKIRLPTELNSKHHPVTIHPHDADDEEKNDHRSATSHIQDDNSDYDNDDEQNGETDFFIIKTKRNRKRPHKRKPKLNDFEDYFEEDYNEDDADFNTKYQHPDNFRNTGLTASTTSTELKESSSAELKEISAKKLHPFSVTKVRLIKQQQQRGRSRHHRYERHNSRHNLKGGVGVYDDGAIEGDVFQYEDFDNDFGRGENQYGGDVSYEDQVDDENGNFSYMSPSKEKATPEHLIPKHRQNVAYVSNVAVKFCVKLPIAIQREAFANNGYGASTKSPSYDLRPVATRRRDISDDDGGTLSNSIGGTLSDYIMNGKGYRGPEYAPMKLKWHCTDTQQQTQHVQYVENYRWQGGS
ncbi:hypothetical protein EVAR_72010_1 [Eumeta japonica]|uniref:Uncharacterized protein n=1 Tax=Eumeta variegata TaxID=151549 RepID=A0A4C1T7T5_EUMVA|nr:hypothetical protein EVAR_72010_1 [Eumeta japonica]